MSSFSSASNYGKNQFIKGDPEVLNNFYNTSDVFPYWVADMDFEVAKPITDELYRLVKRGVYSYEFNSTGVFSAISSWYKERQGLELSSNNFIQVPGVLSGIAILLRMFTNKGDGVLIHTPAYHQFSSLVNKADRTLVQSPLKEKHGQYKIDFEEYEHQITTKNIKVVIFCNPHNPTGRVWSKGEIAKFVEISKRHNVTIISDEIHADIIYKGNTFTSLVNFDYDNIVTLLGSPAKTFGMHSISNGYIYTNNPSLLQKIKTEVSAQYLDHGNALSTFATIAAFTKGSDWLDGMLDYLEGTVDWVEDFISTNISDIKMYRPEGTYQIWFDFSGLGLSEEQLKTLVFKESKMGLTPGSWFGVEGYNNMRMNIATSRDNIIESFNLLAKSIDSYRDGTLSLISGCPQSKGTAGCC